jgi:hypothetical protein
MNGSLTRSAIGCAIACGAFIVGPSLVGATAANADLLGVGGGGVDVLGVDVLGGGGKTKSVNGSQNRVSAVSTAPSTRSVVIRSKDSATPPAGETAQAPAIVPAAYTPPTMMGSPLVDAIPAAPPASVTPPRPSGPLHRGPCR